MSAEEKTVEKSDSSSSFEDLAGDSDLAESKSPAARPKKRAETDNTKDEDWLDILGSQNILKKILEKGNDSNTEDGEEPRKPQRFDLCNVSFSTKLANDQGTIVEEHNRINIYLGDGEIIQGLDLAITLMHSGERCLLKMSPRFAYGDLGLKKSQVVGSAPGFVDVDELKAEGEPPRNDEFVVSPDDWVLIDITLHGWIEEPDNDELTLKERLALGRRRRIRGNWWYGRGDDAAAIRLYRRALDALHESSGGIEVEPDQLQLDRESERESYTLQLIEERCRAHNNLAAAHLRSGALQAASQAVEAVLSCQPDNPKALYRKAKILLLSGDGGAAVEAAKAASAAGAGGAAARLEARATARERREARDERQRAKRMLQGYASESVDPKNGDSKAPKPRNRFLLWGGLLLSFLVGVAGVLIYRYKLIQ